jgi:hypothetical protein
MFDEETFDALRALHVAFEEGEASLHVEQQPLNTPQHLCIKEVLMVGVALVIVYASISLIRKKTGSRHPFRIRRKSVDEIV